MVGARPQRRKARERAFRKLRFDALELYDVRGGRALLALLLVVADLRALGERLEAATLDRAVMDEEVLALVIGRDEAKALVVVEPLDGSCCHCSSLRDMCTANAEVQEQQTR